MNNQISPVRPILSIYPICDRTRLRSAPIPSISYPRSVFELYTQSESFGSSNHISVAGTVTFTYGGQNPNGRTNAFRAAVPAIRVRVNISE